MHGKKASSTLYLWASTIFSSAREFGSPWIGRRKELSNICMINYTSNISQRRNGFLLVLLLLLLLLYNEGEIHISPYLYKASLLLYFRCYSFDNVHNSLFVVCGQSQIKIWLCQKPCNLISLQILVFLWHFRFNPLSSVYF